MQEYGELALALATENNLDIGEHIFNQPLETSFNDIDIVNRLEIITWKKLIDGEKQAWRSL